MSPVASVPLLTSVHPVAADLAVVVAVAVVVVGAVVAPVVVDLSSPCLCSRVCRSAYTRSNQQLSMRNELDQLNHLI